MLATYAPDASEVLFTAQQCVCPASGLEEMHRDAFHQARVRAAPEGNESSSSPTEEDPVRGAYIPLALIPALPNQNLGVEPRELSLTSSPGDSYWSSNTGTTV